MNIELLAPAGDKESLIAAIQNGANAVYLGGSMFSARAFAKNFDREQLLWAISYAHLRNVKIFVTVNTLYKDEEFSQLIDYIDYLYQIQVDALIIQDIGLFDMVHHLYPDFELHMSTQASIMNKYGAKFFEKRGAKRVVLARENTLEEIRDIVQSTRLDVEVFVHGALCVAYSGQCLMSSFIGKRSGNRGECAQPCRLKYRLMEDNKFLDNNKPYLLSPKDLMTIENIGDLIDAGVYSFKIEGRMKRPEYVGSVVKAYRKAIDHHLQKKNVDLKQDIYQMKSMFNRDYTNGYIFHDNQIVSGDYSGNKGIIVGKVIRYNKNKKQVSIQLCDELQQGDSVVMESIDKGRPVNKMYLNGKLVSIAHKNDIIEIEFDYPVYKGNVRKVINKTVIQQIQKTYQKENIKQPINMKFIGKANQPAYLSVEFQDIFIEKTSSLSFEYANHQPLDKQRIYQQLSKLGQTVFTLQNIDIELEDNITIPIKLLNELRRDIIDDLSQKLMNHKIHQYKNSYQPCFESQKASQHYVHVLVSSLDQLNIVLQYPVDSIYYPYQKDTLDAYQLCQKNHKKMILFIPRICKDVDIYQIKNSQIYKVIDQVVVNDYGSYEAFCDKKRIIGTGLNIYNTYSANFYENKKILSLEMSSHQLHQLKSDFRKCIFQVYGKIENMISEYCPISEYYFGKKQKNCHMCQKHKYALIDRKNEKFEIMTDENCRMHLLNSKILYIDSLDKISAQGLLLHFTNEDCQNTKHILDDFYYCLKERKRSLTKEGNQWTLGYFKG